MRRTAFVVPLLNHFHAQMKQFVSRVQSVDADYLRLPMSTSIKIERKELVNQRISNADRSLADFGLPSSSRNGREGRLSAGECGQTEL